MARLRGSLPGLALNSSSTWSAPDGPGSAGVTLEDQPGVRHGQRDQLGDHRAGEAVRRGPPGLGQRDRQPGQLAVQLGHPGGEHLDPVVAGLQLGQPDGGVGAPGQHLVRRGAVLAGQPGQGRPARGDLLQPARFRLQVPEVAGQVGRDVGQAVAQLGQPAGDGGQRLVADAGLQRLSGGRDIAQRPTGLVVTAGHPGQRGGRGLSQVVGRLQPPGLGGQGDVLARLRVDLLDLAQPETQQVDLPGPRLGRRPQPVQLRRGRAALGVPGPVAGQHRLDRVPGEPVQQLALAVRRAEPGLLRLAVDGDQRLGHAGADRGGHLGAAQVGPRPTRRRDVPGDQQLAVLELGAGRDGRGQELGPVGHGEAALDPGPLGAAADRLGIGPATEQQAEAGDHHGLAGAGLAGDDGEPGVQLERGLADHAEVGDAQLSQHRGPRGVGRPAPALDP